MRISEQYGLENAEDWQIAFIRKAEKEIEQCANCSGLPCQKTYPLATPKIKYDADRDYLETETRYPCKYANVQQYQTEIKYLQELSKIPAEYLGKSFEDYEVDANNDAAVEIAKALIENPNKGVYFYGEFGTGKTFLAAITAQEIIKRGRQVIFTTLKSLSEAIRATYNNNSGNAEAEILKQVKNAPTLILDDLGVEKPSRFVCSLLDEVINDRYNSRLQTIITSNYSPEEIREIFNHPIDAKDEVTKNGSRIYSRFKSMIFSIELTGEDRRGYE